MGPEYTVTRHMRVLFQIGLFKEEVQIPEGRLGFQQAKHLAAEIIERKVLCNLNI